MHKKLTYGLVAGTVSTMLLVSCNNGNTSTNITQKLIVSSTDNNSTIFAAKIGESATHTYQVLLASNSGNPGVIYTINVNLPNSQFSVESNGCKDIYQYQSCNIIINFAPIAESNYNSYNPLIFSVGQLESTIIAVTQPMLKSVTK